MNEKKDFLKGRKVSAIYGWIKFYSSYEIDLDGPLPEKFNPDEIKSIGENCIDSEFHHLIIFENDESISIDKLRDIKNFYKELFSSEQYQEKGIKLLKELSSILYSKNLMNDDIADKISEIEIYLSGVK